MTTAIGMACGMIAFFAWIFFLLLRDNWSTKTDCINLEKAQKTSQETIASLEYALTERESVILDRQTTIAERDAEIARLQTIVLSRNADNLQLNDRLARIHALSSEGTQ